MIVLLCMPVGRLTAQTLLNLEVSGRFHNASVFEFLEVIENQYNVRILYEPSRIPYFRTTLAFDREPLFRAAEKFLVGSKLSLIKYKEHLIIAQKEGITAERLEEIISRWEQGIYRKPASMEERIIELTLGDSLVPQRGLQTFSGTITDKYSGSPVVGALLQNLDDGTGTTTDAHGHFALELPSGQYVYRVTYLGYQPTAIHLALYAYGSLDIQMEVTSLDLSEVVVEAYSRQQRVTDTRMGVQALSMRDVREIPAMMGEADVFKSLERLPSISTVSEASAGFNVRGGNVDQNLILLDDGILLNASHALGFLSILNPDALSQVTVYTGSIPAMHGGRLSSVLRADIGTGNSKAIRGRGAVSIGSSRLTVDGPLNSKIRFLAGGRASYADWILRLFRNPDIRKSSLQFYDGVIKASMQLNAAQTVEISSYHSADQFRFATEFGFGWNTSQQNLRWRTILSDATSIQLGLVRGRYKSELAVLSGDQAAGQGGGISYEKLVSGLVHQRRRQLIQSGIEVLYWHMLPETLQPLHSSQVRSKIVARENAVEMAAYLHDEVTVSDRFGLEAGLRLVRYMALGPSEVRTYLPDMPRSSETVSEVRSVARNKSIVSYPVAEPRLSVRYQWSDHMSVKAAFNRVNQFMHLLSASVNPTPVDIWQLSNADFRPQRGSQVSMGYFHQSSSRVDYSIEAFYKTIDNLPQFRDNAVLQVNEYLEAELVPGEGRAYGVEYLIETKGIKWHTSLAYTLSRSEARTTGAFDQINGNTWYAAPFDQRHQVQLLIQFRPDPIQRLFVGFGYKTGRPVTVPIGNYALQDIVITHYSARNQYRLPPFIRVDFGYTIDRSEARRQGLRSSITMSFMNLLGRRNPFSIYFRRDLEGAQRAYQLSVLGTILPSLNWTFTF